MVSPLNLLTGFMNESMAILCIVIPSVACFAGFDNFGSVEAEFWTSLTERDFNFWEIFLIWVPIGLSSKHLRLYCCMFHDDTKY